MPEIVLSRGLFAAFNVSHIAVQDFNFTGANCLVNFADENFVDEFMEQFKIEFIDAFIFFQNMSRDDSLACVVINKFLLSIFVCTPLGVPRNRQTNVIRLSNQKITLESSYKNSTISLFVYCPIARKVFQLNIDHTNSPPECLLGIKYGANYPFRPFLAKVTTNKAMSNTTFAPMMPKDSIKLVDTWSPLTE